jgi:hypothetical protein
MVIEDYKQFVDHKNRYEKDFLFTMTSMDQIFFGNLQVPDSSPCQKQENSANLSQTMIQMRTKLLYIISYN